MSNSRFICYVTRAMCSSYETISDSWWEILSGEMIKSTPVIILSIKIQMICLHWLSLQSCTMHSFHGNEAFTLLMLDSDNMFPSGVRFSSSSILQYECWWCGWLQMCHNPWFLKILSLTTQIFIVLPQNHWLNVVFKESFQTFFEKA